MIYLVVGILFLVVLIDIGLLILWKEDMELKDVRANKKVSILIAARNEAANIEVCIESLLNQDYPSELIQILVGDDQSEDDTFNLASNKLRDITNSKVIKITAEISHQKGKANVLAQLAKQATGEVLMITDADMQLPPTWVKSMINGISEDGIITGVTHVKGNVNQNIDWIFSLGMTKVLYDYGLPVTTMGNNMMITKKAYDAIGGYENIPFSITEDYELFKQVKKKNYSIVQLYNPLVLGITNPVSNYLALLKQRKRWMRGAIQLPWLVVLILLAQALYFPALIVLSIVNIQLGLSFFALKVLIQGLFILKCANSLHLKFTFTQLLMYEFHALLVSIGSSIYYLLPIGVSWKGRKY